MEFVDTGATVNYDAIAGVQIATNSRNQWVTYDDSATFAQKLNYANKNCIGGVSCCLKTHAFDLN